MSNFDQLAAAGLLNSKFPFSASERSLIESLTAAEVAALISVKLKMGSFLSKHGTPDVLDAAEDSGARPAIGIVF